MKELKRLINLFWNYGPIHNKVLKHVEKDYQNKKSENLIKITNKFIKDITNNLDKFGYNIVVANIHKLYSELNKELNFEHKKEILLENYKKILICIMPIIPFQQWGTRKFKHAKFGY